MTTTNDNPGSGSPEQPFNAATLLRLAADGELTDAQREALDAHLAEHPDDQSRIEFEGQLRSACGRAMNDDSVRCPDALRSKVEQIAAAARQTAEADAKFAAMQAGLQAGLDDRAAVTRDQGFWASGGMQRVLGALAAAIVLVASAGFLIQMSQNAGNGVSSAEGMIQRASFVAGEHRECDVNPARLAKFTVQELELAPSKLARVLGGEPTIPDLEAAGFVFQGVGECRLPGGGRSAHLRMIAPRFADDPNARSDGGVGVMVSLFMQTGEQDPVPMEEGRAYELSLPEIAAESRLDYAPSVYAWRVGEVSYYLVAEQQLPCTQLAESIGLEIVPCR